MGMKRLTAVLAGLALAGAGGAAISAAAASAAPVHQAVKAAPPGGPVPAGFEVASVTFVSAADGWVLGTTKTCAHAPCTSVLRTTNGGRTWAGIPAPRFRLAPDPGSAGLVRLRFASTSTGFAYGSQLWVTRNGGASWHRVRQVPGDITDLETAGGTVYATADRGGMVRVYSTPVGATAWHRVAALAATAGSAGLGSITLYGHAAWIILGERIYHSAAGSSWSRLGFSCPADWGIASLAAANAQHVSVLCAGSPGLGSTRKRVYVSASGGSAFTLAGHPPAGGDGGLLAEPTSRHLFIATASGASWTYVSTDGGRHWARGTLSRDDGGLGWNDFGFTTARQGVAVEGRPAFGSALWITRDAGAHWHKVVF